MDDPQNRKDLKAEPKPVIIEDNVWITANCIILPGVIIGEGSVVGAGSVVNQDIPPRSLVMGNPVQIIKTWEEEKK
jgi:galactoside O-acetyltransferase